MQCLFGARYCIIAFESGPDGLRFHGRVDRQPCTETSIDDLDRGELAAKLAASKDGQAMQKYLRQRKACTHMHRRCKRLWDPQGQVETPHPLTVADAARIVAAANAKMERGPIKRKRKRGRQPKKANNTPAAKKSKTMLDFMDGASLGSPPPSVRRQRPTTSPPACRLASSQSRGMADVDGNSYLNATLQCLRRLPLQSAKNHHTPVLAVQNTTKHNNFGVPRFVFPPVVCIPIPWSFLKPVWRPKESLF